MSTHHRALITRCSLLAAAVTVASYSSVHAADLTVPGTHATLQAAVAAAADSDRIILADGTHTLSATLQVNKAITIEGQSRGGTIINATATSLGWGINVDSSNVTLKNFTVVPPVGTTARGTSNGGAFPIHAGYHWDANPALRTPHANLTLQDITIDDSNRTAFDIHGFDNVTLSGLTATDAAYGNGINLSGCTNVTITGCTTSGNAWGGIAVYASKSADLSRPSSNVNFSFAANNVAEYFYIEEEQGLVSTANLTGTTYQIDNDYAPSAASMAYYTNGDLTKATTLAQGLNVKYSNTASVLNTAIGDTLVVPGLSLQAAINAATPGDTISVSGAITLSSPVTLNKQLVIDGGNKATTSISGSNALAGYFILANGASGGSIVKNISFNKTDKAGVQNMIGLQAPNIAFEDCNFTGQYVLGDGDVSRAFEISGSANGFRIEDCSITGLRQPAYINAVSSGQVLNNYVAGTRGWVVDGGLVQFSGNSWGTGPNANAVDIALLNSTPTSPLYDPLATLIANNNNATISNQRSSSQVFNTTKGIGYPTIQAAINAADNGDSITAYAATFNEDVTINKDVTLQGAGVGQSVISGPIGGDGATIRIASNGVTVSGFTITRAGNAAATWNDPGLNSAGIAIQGGVTGTLINNNLITGNRSAIDVNNSNGHTFRNNIITENHTGVIFRNQTDSITFVENSVVNNRTVGVLFLDASGGTNVPVQTAAACTFSNNEISGNWYGQVVDRQAGGVLPAPGTNLKNFEGNWYGTSAPVVSTANSAEPGYAMLIPVSLGGTATPPAAQPHIAGPASTNIDYKSYLSLGLDTNVETVLGRGTYGFQGKQSSLWDGTTVSETVSGTQTHTNLFVPAGKTITVPATGSLIVTGKLELAPGASIVVNGGELVIGEDSKISGTFTIFNSFGSWDINGDTTFEIGRSLALVTDVHIAAGAVVTVNGGGELILDGCVIDSQTGGSPYAINVEDDGLLTIARSVVSDASIDINTEAASVPEYHRSKVYDSRFTNSEIEASPVSAVYHNLFDSATNGASNTDASAAFAAVDGWGNVTSSASLKNRFALEFGAPVLADRTLEDGNLFVQTGDAVSFNLKVDSLAPNTITAAEALLGYNSERLILSPGPSAVAPASGWTALLDDDSVNAPLGLVDSALALNLVPGNDDGIAGPATIGSVNFAAGTAGATVGFFRVQTDGNYSPDGSFMKDTRLTKSSGGIPSFLTAFTANTGELVVDNSPPTIAVPAVSGVQTQPTVGSVSILQPTSNVVIRGQTLAPVILTFTATDAGLSGLDADDATNDLALTANNGAGTILDSDDYTVSATEASGVVTYVVTLNIPAGAGNGTYAISAVVQDRSGNDSAPASLGSFVIANEVLATVELQGFVGTGPASLRNVTFVATGGASTKTWVKPVSFTSSLGTVVLDNVPAGTTGISAKTAWTLRSKKVISLLPAGAGSVSLTGTDKLNAGDLNGDNVVNTLDFSILRYYWLSSVSGNPAAAVSDITGEGMINAGDYNVLTPNFYTAGDAQ